MNEVEGFEMKKLITQLNGMRTKLQNRDRRIKDLQLESLERKESVDRLSAELGKLKRKMKRYNHD